MNIYQEAFEKVVRYVAKNEVTDQPGPLVNPELEKALKTLNELVERSVPKKVIEKEIPPCVLTAKYCPSCGRKMVNYSYHIPYCEHCGQKIEY